MSSSTFVLQVIMNLYLAYSNWPSTQGVPPYPYYPYQWQAPQYDGYPQPAIHNPYQQPTSNHGHRQTTHRPPQAWVPQPQNWTTAQQPPYIQPPSSQNVSRRNDGARRQEPQLSEPAPSHRQALPPHVSYIPCPYCNHPIETKADDRNNCCRYICCLCAILCPCTDICLAIDCCKVCYSLTKVGSLKRQNHH